MSSTSLPTGGVLGGAIGLATDGVLSPPAVDELPAPIEVSFPVPYPPPADCPPSNPRPIVPALNLRVPANPGCSLVEDFAGLADDMRQMAADFGLRPYLVYSVVVRWSGGERHRGTPSVVWEAAFLPVPKVEGTDQIAHELRAGGDVKRGTLRLTGLSARYTQDDIEHLFCRRLRTDEEHYIEVRVDGRDGTQVVRSRYVISAEPERGVLGWSVRLTKHDEDRTRSGRPR